MTLTKERKEQCIYQTISDCWRANMSIEETVDHLKKLQFSVANVFVQKRFAELKKITTGA